MLVGVADALLCDIAIAVFGKEQREMEECDE